MDNGILYIVIFGSVFLFIILIIFFLNLFNVFKKDKKEKTGTSIFFNLFMIFSLGAILFILLCTLALGLLCK